MYIITDLTNSLEIDYSMKQKVTKENEEGKLDDKKI